MSYILYTFYYIGTGTYISYSEKCNNYNFLSKNYFTYLFFKLLLLVL